MNTYRKELVGVAQFLKDATGIKVSIPDVKLSDRISDIEEYSFDGNKSSILINLEYLGKYEQKTGQGISVNMLLAHSFFHHVQTVLKINYARIAKKLILKAMGKATLKRRNLVKEASANLIESSAMFFACAYFVRGRDRKIRIIKMLKQEAYLPPPQKHICGNGLLIAYLRDHSINQTLKTMLPYSAAH